MKIIKQGQLPDKHIFRGECSKCHTIFECERGEGQYESSKRDGGFLRVNCPYCRKDCVAYKKDDGALINPGSPPWNEYGNFIVQPYIFG